MPSALMMEKKSPALDFDCRNCEMAMAPFFQSKYKTTFIHGIGKYSTFPERSKKDKYYYTPPMYLSVNPKNKYRCCLIQLRAAPASV